VQERKVNTEHVNRIGTSLLLGDQTAVNGIRHREVKVRAFINLKSASAPALGGSAVDAIRKLVSIDFAGAPSPELSLELG
jgi:hypothetical protein